MSEHPILYGASYSVYVRAVRLTLAEKGVPYTLVPVDVFAPGGPPADHLARQPFGRIPAFEHGRFRLYEAGAIMRYIDEAFAGPSLQPEGAEARARANQIISILDSYAYPSLVRGIFVERVSVPRRGQVPDEATLQAAIPMAITCLKALADIRGAGPFLAGSVLTLADLHAIPMFACFHATPEAEDLLRPHAGLREWWQRVAERPSIPATAT
ncbi:glutathione S-transferase family protein [Roseomonas sp. OT10]|uniref:glutathione S-transferase family protein n=1 Tax=Roseomonas cutis TaxID=2897332 RepID=UPI001E2A88DD|nr:glutathione S-transferase family protein [Roseomonas sp. OT10]UFN47022.1 glutathione S-transferase family protein [Roseomonas sp. OT10]